MTERGFRIVLIFGFFGGRYVGKSLGFLSIKIHIGLLIKMTESQQAVSESE